MINTPRLAKNAVVNTKDLTLRSFTAEDFPSCAQILMHDEVKKTYMLPDLPDTQSAYPLFQKLSDLSADPYRYVYAIAFEGKLVGFMNDVEIDGNSIEVGYVIHPDWQNRGFATQALSALIKELFRVGFQTVKAGFFQENTASRRVMEKAGMRKIPYEDDIEYRGKTHHCLYCAAFSVDVV